MVEIKKLAYALPQRMQATFKKVLSLKMQAKQIVSTISPSDAYACNLCGPGGD